MSYELFRKRQEIVEKGKLLINIVFYCIIQKTRAWPAKLLYICTLMQAM